MSGEASLLCLQHKMVSQDQFSLAGLESRRISTNTTKAIIKLI